MEKYNILETIGDGTYGLVYKAVNTKNSKIKPSLKMN
jgi:serine/threonine protein kinase